MMMPAARLCVLRARFFRLEVRRFGTAMSLSSVGNRFPGVTAGALVQVDAARWATPLAVGVAEHKRGHFEAPLLPEGRAQVHFRAVAAAAQRKNIRIVGTLRAVLG